MIAVPSDLDCWMHAIGIVSSSIVLVIAGLRYGALISFAETVEAKHTYYYIDSSSIPDFDHYGNQ